MGGIQKIPPMPLADRSACSLGIARRSDSQHENIEVASIVDMVGCHVPFDSLDDDAWDTSARAKVTTKSSKSDDE